MQTGNVFHLEQRRTHWRWAFVVSLVVVLVLALMPARLPMPSTGWDKANHALAFTVLAILGCRSYPRRTALVLLGLLMYGGMIELLQGLTGYRMAEWLDLATDGVGLALGFALTRVQGLATGLRACRRVIRSFPIDRSNSN